MYKCRSLLSQVANLMLTIAVSGFGEEIC